MVSLREMAKKGGTYLLDLIYPSRCVVCEASLSPEAGMDGLCERCFSRIPRNTPPFCPGCGRDYAGTPDAPRCGACSGKRFPYERLWFAAPYEGAMRNALHAFKYRNRRPLARPLSRLLADFAKAHLSHVPYQGVVPVPLSRKKERERTFNQSALLAEAVASALSAPLSVGNLIRVQPTLPQIHLPKTKRFGNVREAFRVRHPSAYRKKRLLLVDDIVTTGATVSSCARALRACGAGEISVLALAGPAGGA